ncbi:MAG: YfiR/HmsC family protein, partial [Gammaproteobacteria bacterium]|nr:YfiR/HmsC family protein [Gammaproteobacteria bacterium]
MACCLLALPLPLYPQDFSEEAIKAELVVQFIDHIHWPDENANSFRIAFIGSDPSFFEFIQNTITNREVRGKTLTLSRADLSELAAYDVVVVAENQSASLAAIFDVLRASSTLIISDSSDDRTHAMINLHQTPDQTISFKVNRANLVVRKLQVGADILLLGGSEMDVAELYRDMEERLSTMHGEMEAVRRLSASALEELTTSQAQLRQSEQELLAQSLDLNKQSQTITDQSTLIENQLSSLRAGQAELDGVNESFRENRALLEDQLDLLADRTNEVDRQHALVATNVDLLAGQAEQIAEQRANIQIQSGTIRVQELGLYSALFVLLVISVLAVVIYRISQDRKKISQQLAQRGLELEEQANARTIELTDSEGRYRALSELSPTAVYGTDNRGRCVYVNERWCEFSGLTRGESLGRLWFEALHPDDRSQFETQDTKLSGNGEIISSEFRFMTPHGEITWVYGQRTAQKDENGNVIGFIATAADITEHKQLEEQLRQA